MACVREDEELCLGDDVLPLLPVRSPRQNQENPGKKIDWLIPIKFPGEMNFLSFLDEASVLGGSLSALPASGKNCLAQPLQIDIKIKLLPLFEKKKKGLQSHDLRRPRGVNLGKNLDSHLLAPSIDDTSCRGI